MRRPHYIWGLAIFAALVFTGCYSGPNKYTGGGWIEVCEAPDFQETIVQLDDVLDGPCSDCGKATFGFQFKGIYDEVCEEATISGQLQWNDHVRDVKFHGIVDEAVRRCRGPICFYGADCVIGEYRPQPTKLGEPGHFQLCVRDSGEPGPDAGDKISIKLWDGHYDGYSVVGTWLGGGNIQAHYED